jgi:murein DD-endopeptidase MepM/ murein hydrolase activator NlpD
MHLDVPPSDQTMPGAQQVSRRRFVLGGLAGLGLGVAAASRLGPSTVSAAGDELNLPGAALQTAQRVTTTTTVPVPVLKDDEVLFPIVVGRDDSCYVFDNFGACRSGCSRSHEGTDIMADHLLPIRAVANGILTKKYEDSGQLSGAGHGWTLFDEEKNVTWKFFHMDHHAEGLEVGDRVELGQIIGAVGNTGTSGAKTDTNYHLHFEYRPGDVPKNVYALLQRDPNVTFA